jgi:hypothetical protein
MLNLKNSGKYSSVLELKLPYFGKHGVNKTLMPQFT